MAGAVKKNKTAMEWEEIERVVTDEISVAEDYVERVVSPERTERWDRYYGRKLGNEKPGRSKYISRDTLETIEWILPTLMRTLGSGDPKVELEIEGKPGWVGKAVLQKIQDDLDDNDEVSKFKLFYTWFKDSLVSGTSAVKTFWDYQTVVDEQTIPMLNPGQFAQLQNAPMVEVVSYDSEEMMFGAIYRNVKIRVTRPVVDTLRADNIPHWEILFPEEARDVNDRHPKGHKTEVSLDYLKRVNSAYSEDEEDYFKNLDKLESGVGGSDELNSEEVSFRGHSDMFPHRLSGASTDDPENGKRTVELIEWYTQLDVNGDGLLENCIAWIGDGVLLRYEVNNEDFIPMCILKPIIDPYKFEGLAYSDLIIEVQNLKTMLLRRILDNFDFQNNGRWFRKPGATVDMEALMDGVPGDVITADPDAVVNVGPQPFHPSNLTLIEYIDTVKEQRTGSTRYNQGLDADSLNKTATGIAAIQGAAQQRIELISRIFLETGLVDFYKKCTFLIQKHQDKPFVTRVRGRVVKIDPPMLRGRVKVKVMLGVETQVGIAEAQKIERMFGFLMNVNKMYPGLLGPEQIHNLATRYVASIGFKQTEEFLTDIQAYAKQVQQMIQARQQQAQQAQQMESRKEMGKLQIKAETEKMKRQTNMEKMALEDKISQREAAVDVYKAKQTKEPRFNI